LRVEVLGFRGKGEEFMCEGPGFRVRGIGVWV
jgi:hypothetical protein